MRYHNNYHSGASYSGFSLLELMVVLVLASGLLMIAFTSINALTGTDIKSEITKMAGMASESFSRAAIVGKTQRLVFDLDNNQYWLEEKNTDVGVISPELGYEELMKQAQKKQIDSEEADKNPYIPTFGAVEGVMGEKQKLKSSLVIHGVWTEQMSEVMRAGLVYIYFFSDGYTQSSFVSVAEKGHDDNVFYFSLSPLTGAVSIGFSEPQISDLTESERES